MAPKSSPIDLDAYASRLGVRLEARPTLQTLRTLQFAHVAAIPFENLSPLLGEPVRLDPASLQDKLVRRRRGGWCFEHNLLFTHALRAVGFDVQTLAARVRWNVPPGVDTPRSHCLLLVTVEGERYIADVGFGGLTLTAPLRLAEGEQATPHEPHRLVSEEDRYALEAKVAGEWQRLYVFDLVPALQADYEVSNWYLAHHPESQFVKGVVAARADRDRRHALRNTRYSVHYGDGRTDRRFLTDVDELKAVLASDLRIPLPDDARLDAILQRVIEANPPS
jgi:N-hydroxyarylamine O-acetyltransferase